MSFEGWYLLLGGLLLVVACVDTVLKRLPITTTIMYLFVGLVLGPLVLGIGEIDPVAGSHALERISELVVIISLFTAGLKLRAPFAENRWKLAVRLAFVSMTITVALIAGFAVIVLGLPLGVAVILGAVLAPTDPVLASDVQLEHAGDRDRLRFSLTGEAGLNDGTAFPFVMLGLGLIGAHDLGTAGWKWLAVDVLWAIGGGLGIGALLGTAVAKLVVALRQRREETVGRDEFIALGLIGVAYGVALFLHTYGFLAVFAAGLALRQFELRKSGGRRVVEEDLDGGLDDPAKAPAHVAHSVLEANEQLERILEVAVVLILGMMLSRASLDWRAVWLIAALFLVIRPLAVMVGTIGCQQTGLQRTLVSWFGVRGVGSVYYLMYAIEHGLETPYAAQLSSFVLLTVAASVLLHGISVSPIMSLYERRKGRRGKQL